jgi:hypothetical protein
MIGSSMSQGQIYASGNPRINTEINNFIKPLSRTLALPGGSVKFTVVNGLSFADL